jgi:hypothetical protein
MENKTDINRRGGTNLHRPQQHPDDEEGISTFDLDQPSPTEAPDR